MLKKSTLEKSLGIIKPVSPRGQWVKFSIRKMHLYMTNNLTVISILTHWGRDKMTAIFQTTFSSAFLEWKRMNSIKISLKIVATGPINNILELVQIMAWCRPGDRPLSEPMLVCLLTHICVTRPQWVKMIPYDTLYQVSSLIVFHEKGFQPHLIFQCTTKIKTHIYIYHIYKYKN